MQKLQGDFGDNLGDSGGDNSCNLDDGGGDNSGKDGRDYTCLLLYSYTTAQTNIGIPVFVIVMF